LTLAGCWSGLSQHHRINHLSNHTPLTVCMTYFTQHAHTRELIGHHPYTPHHSITGVLANSAQLLT
jgi:hypothetical protein